MVQGLFAPFYRRLLNIQASGAHFKGNLQLFSFLASACILSEYLGPFGCWLRYSLSRKSRSSNRGWMKRKEESFHWQKRNRRLGSPPRPGQVSEKSVVCFLLSQIGISLFVVSKAISLDPRVKKPGYLLPLRIGNITSRSL